MNGLEAQTGDVGNEWDPVRPYQWAREERAREQPANPGGGFALEDQSRPHSHDPPVGQFALESIEATLELGLMARVEARLHSIRRPALVDAAVLGTRRVRPDRG